MGVGGSAGLGEIWAIIVGVGLRAGVKVRVTVVLGVSVVVGVGVGVVVRVLVGVAVGVGVLVTTGVGVGVTIVAELVTSAKTAGCGFSGLRIKGVVINPKIKNKQKRRY